VREKTPYAWEFERKIRRLRRHLLFWIFVASAALSFIALHMRLSHG
jgi:hypothetical protein